MHAAEWIAIIPTTLLVCGTAVGVIVKLTRLVDAVERLTASIGRVDNHEERLRVLEVQVLEHSGRRGARAGHRP